MTEWESSDFFLISSKYHCLSSAGLDPFEELSEAATDWSRSKVLFATIGVTKRVEGH